MLRLIALFLLAAASAIGSDTLHFETSVAPAANEDIASDCHAAMTIAAPEYPVSAVWVIYDRGRDVHDLYSDPDVLALARRFRLALLLHAHCPGKKAEDRGDMNMEPAEGLGPVLFRMLNQFAQISGHPELPDAKLILLGFSGAGSLCARMVGFASDRVVAAILSAPGHFEPQGIDTVQLKQDALRAPELIMAAGHDDVSGTARPYAYFKKYRDLGAPWAFVMQNNSPHCCTANAKKLILLWLTAILEQRKLSSSAELAQVDQGKGWLAFIRTESTNTKDSFGLTTFNAGSATVEKVGKKAPKDWLEAGWLPNREVAQEWLVFVQQRQHPVLPLR